MSCRPTLQGMVLLNEPKTHFKQLLAEPLTGVVVHTLAVC